MNEHGFKFMLLVITKLDHLRRDRARQNQLIAIGAARAKATTSTTLTLALNPTASLSL
jgi:hypothetical protein